MQNLESVYKIKWIVEHIYEVSERHRNTLSDTGAMEDEMFGRVARYTRCDSDKLKHNRIIRKLIGEVASKYVREYRNEDYDTFSQYETINEEGETVELDPRDESLDVESDVVQKDTAALLAQDDRRNEVIVEYWSLGNTDGREISRALEKALGGKAESHRKYINRFRQACKTRYTALVQ